MNGPQDLGGMMGFGPVVSETDEPIFHAPWEARVLGVTLCCGALGYWSIDESRHARETLPPVEYLSSSYYRIWLLALEKLLKRHGELINEELVAGTSVQPGLRADRKLTADRVPVVLSSGGPADRALDREPGFGVGDTVRTINDHPTGHTRLPRYARGRQGVVSAVHAPHVFPDASAHGGGDDPQWLYTVVFEGRELWGRTADPNMEVSIDAWEAYLEAV